MVNTSTATCGLSLGDLSGRRDAVEVGHVQVHHHDVGLQLAGEADRLGAGLGLADDLDAGLDASSACRPLRNTGWSSAMTTRSGAVMTASGIGRRARDARARSADDVWTGAAEFGRAFAHRGEADAGGLSAGSPLPSSVTSTPERAVAAKSTWQVLARGVPRHVRHRLGGDPVRGDLDGGRQRRRGRLAAPAR